MFSVRRLIAFVCVVAVLLAAMSPVAPGLHWAILVPLLCCIAVVVLVPLNRESNDILTPAFPVLSALVPRAPPSV
jgi:hypothetical protein